MRGKCHVAQAQRILEVALGAEDKRTVKVVTFEDGAGREAGKSRYPVSPLFKGPRGKVSRGLDPDTMLDRQRSGLQRELSARV